MSKWISVDDRLPSFNKNTTWDDKACIPCLVVRFGQVMFMVYTNRSGFVDRIGYQDYFRSGSDNITHWMPLPKPPKP